MPLRIEQHDSLPSTSLLLRERIESGAIDPVPLLVTARRQTAGIGRYGRRWESPPGGLWMTLALPLERGRTLPPALGVRLALATARGLERAFPALASVRIKWPNDLLLNERKVCGILTERIEKAPSAWLLAGVGVNADCPPERLPPELRAHSTTLREVLDGPIDLVRLRDSIAGELLRAIRNDPPDARWKEDARSRLWGVGREVKVDRPGAAGVSARIVGLADDGRPLVLIEGREEALPANASIRARADTPRRWGARGK